MKYSHEEKLSAVRSVSAGTDSLRSAASKLGTDHKLIRQWLSRYERYGEDGLRLRSGSYSGDFKLSVLQYMHKKHLSLFETAVHFGIPSDSIVLTWDRIYRKEGSAGLYRDNRGKRMKPEPPKIPKGSTENEALLKELEYLRAENAYLKKLRVLVEERIERESVKEPKPSKD